MRSTLLCQVQSLEQDTTMGTHTGPCLYRSVIKQPKQLALPNTAAAAMAAPAATQPSQHRHAELWRRLQVTLLEVTFYYYPSLLTTVLSLFSCFRIDPVDGGYHNAKVSLLLDTAAPFVAIKTWFMPCIQLQCQAHIYLALCHSCYPTPML